MEWIGDVFIEVFKLWYVWVGIVAVVVLLGILFYMKKQQSDD